jgi:2,3-bisphosphoglycerate-independent phosphoglycerate mutase
MWDEERSEPYTAHTVGPVPLILDARGAPRVGCEALASGGSLEDVAPTLLGMMGIERPKEMTGRDLRVDAAPACENPAP